MESEINDMKVFCKLWSTAPSRWLSLLVNNHLPLCEKQVSGQPLWIIALEDSGCLGAGEGPAETEGVSGEGELKRMSWKRQVWVATYFGPNLLHGFGWVISVAWASLSGKWEKGEVGILRIFPAFIHILNNCCCYWCSASRLEKKKKKECLLGALY